ncbi:hypothetical protein [Nocardia camponoti]|uniref:Lipoprotein n=1 Tax=Nocardia camponoti TaxID=1616106 RepID=A0A917QU18_9NOCA|nr:hypothetical protein [Nocardia camponoti]GGK68719.1 hypothetical protein GCM10011591_46040 [Nocardia camponoti]
MTARTRRSLTMLAGICVAVALASCADRGRDTEPSTPADGASSTTTTFVTPTATTSRVPATVPSTPVAAPSTLPPEIGAVDDNDPAAVATAVARIWFSWDTTRDTSPYDAKLRAVPLLEPAVADQLRQYPPVAGPGADWLELTAQSARLTVPADGVRPAAEAGGPTDTDISVSRLFEVTQRVTTATGPKPDRQLIVAVVVHRIDGAWRAGQVATR